MYSGVRLETVDASKAEPALRRLRQQISSGLRTRLALGAQVSIRTRHGQTLDVAWRMPLRAERTLVVRVKIELLLETRDEALYVVPMVSDHAYIESRSGDPMRWAPSGATARKEWSKFTTRVQQVLGHIFEGPTA